jgi:hypothetical protein
LSVGFEAGLPEQRVRMESAMTRLDSRDEAPRYARKPEGLAPLVDYDPVTDKWFDSGAMFSSFATRDAVPQSKAVADFVAQWPPSA